jgi:hypothetical protein
MIICTKIVVFLIVGETGDLPDKLNFCWRHTIKTYSKFLCGCRD